MTVEDAMMLAEDRYSNRTEQVLAEEVRRLREQLATAEESSRVNYAAFSDQLYRHKEALKRAEAAEAEVARLREALETIAGYSRLNGCCPYGCDTPTIAKNALEAKP